MTEALLDANTLIATFDQSHADHPRARKFFESLDNFYTCPQVQGAFLRFFSRPWTDAEGTRRDPRMSTGKAFSCLREIFGLQEHRFLADDLCFDKVSMRSLSGFKQWNDAYLIALARNHGLKLCTLEKKLNNMDDPQSPVLFIV